jgi:uncharacterized protein (DUF2461 family)
VSDTDDTTMDRGTFELFGQIIEANARSLEHTTNVLLENYELQAAKWAQRYVELYELMFDEPVLSRAMHEYLASITPLVDYAAEVAQRAEKEAP